MRMDLHTHSQYSFDADRAPATVWEMAETAAARGLELLAVTDHYDLFRHKPAITYDIAAVQAEVDAASSRLDGSLTLLKGIELGEPHAAPAQAEALLETYAFDVVIGSLHAMPNDLDLYFHDYDTIDCDALLRDYFAEVLRMEQQGGFDVLAHLDYPLRVMKRPGTQPSFDRFAEHIAPVLREAVRRGYALEINAASLFSWMEHPGPDQWILREFRRMGGERISIGSDAHCAADLGRGVDACIAWARQAGFTGVTAFRARQPVFVPF